MNNQNKTTHFWCIKKKNQWFEFKIVKFLDTSWNNGSASWCCGCLRHFVLHQCRYLKNQDPQTGSCGDASGLWALLFLSLPKLHGCTLEGSAGGPLKDAVSLEIFTEPKIWSMKLHEKGKTVRKKRNICFLIWVARTHTHTQIQTNIQPKALWSSDCHPVTGAAFRYLHSLITNNTMLETLTEATTGEHPSEHGEASDTREYQAETRKRNIHIYKYDLKF